MLRTLLDYLLYGQIHYIMVDVMPRKYGVRNVAVHTSGTMCINTGRIYKLHYPVTWLYNAHKLKVSRGLVPGGAYIHV